MTAAISKYFSLIVAILLCVWSLVAFAINYFIFGFPGNNYFPPGTPLIGAILFLMLLGVYLLFDKSGPFFQIACELIYFFLVLIVMVFVVNTAQYTPFPPIDRQLISVDSALYINLQEIVAWTADRPWLREILGMSYNSLQYQVAYLPLIIIAGRKINYIREFYALLLLTALFGFTFYYFFPTMGPASFIESPYFFKEQYATGIKFTEIHRHLLPTTLDGGMVAMPSFHVIWAWLCLYMVRCWPVVFILLLPVNLLLVASCVLLGWHYFIDLIGSVIVLLVAHGIYSWAKYGRPA
jgi:PAP2 superfamily